MRLALPGCHTEEVQLDMRMRIDEPLDQPREGARYLDAQFLAEFAHQRGIERLARFDLAAGKLPVAGVDFAGRPLPEKNGAVVSRDDGGDDLQQRRRTPEFLNLMAFETERAWSYYRRAERLTEFLSPPGRRVLAAMRENKFNITKPVGYPSRS